jgi:serine/threonine-protein kinase RsbW
MNSWSHGQVLGRLAADEFFDRQSELEHITALGSRPRLGAGALLLGSPHAGKTELLCQSFDRLFSDSGDVIPIYYRVRPDLVDPREFGRDFLATLLSQFVAFRRSDPEIVWGAHQLLEVQPLALPEDYSQIRRIAEAAGRAEGLSDSTSLLRLALRAPVDLASATGLRILLLIDDFHHLVTSEQPLVRSEFNNALRARPRPHQTGVGSGAATGSIYVLSGLRRPMLGLLPAEEEFFDKFELIRMRSMADDTLDTLISQLASRSGIHVSDSTRELMIQQLGRDLFYIRALVSAATSRGAGLKTFIEFERVYTEELLNGRIGHYLDARLRDAAAAPAQRRAALVAIALALETGDGIPLDAVADRMGMDQTQAETLLGRLYDRELLDIGFGFVRCPDDPVLADYVRCRYREEIIGSRPPLAGYELLGEKLKDSYRLMMSRYSRAVEAHLVELLLRFDFQSVPASLLDAGDFDERYAGLSRVQVRRSIDEEQQRIRLPQIAFVSDLGSGDQGGLNWKLIAACGFEGGVYSESNEILWLIALLSAKEPIDLETLEAVERRMELVSKPARRGRHYGRGDWGGGRIVRWIISKEGFTPEALSRAARIQAFRSTYSQLDLVYDYLVAISAGPAAAVPVSEFELVIPIEDDAELIAARTVEQIARTADFDAEAINQIKTALIEACLNAAEHSDSPDRRIYQKFTLTEEGLVITVSNKGNRFEPIQELEAMPAASGKRGRGLQIIRALMDDVHFESTDDGASLVMSKYLRRTGSS